jgi:hypothetical protein
MALPAKLEKAFQQDVAKTLDDVRKLWALC